MFLKRINNNKSKQTTNKQKPHEGRKQINGFCELGIKTWMTTKDTDQSGRAKELF